MKYLQVSKEEDSPNDFDFGDPPTQDTPPEPESPPVGDQPTKPSQVEGDSSDIETPVIQKEPDQKSTEDVNTKTVLEKEYVVYARILNFAVFKNASHAEAHEQWECPIPATDLNYGEGRVRAREVTNKDGEHKYEITLKTKTKDAQFESTSRCNKETYTQMAFLADKGMKKQRYTFPIPNSDLKWEVDAYPDKKGGFYPWIRMELEVKKELDKLPELPFEVEETILPDQAQTEEGKKKVDELFNRYFLLPNKYAVKAGKVPSSLDIKPKVDVTPQEKQKMEEEVKEKEEQLPDNQESNDNSNEPSSNNEVSSDDQNKEDSDNDSNENKEDDNKEESSDDKENNDDSKEE